MEKPFFLFNKQSELMNILMQCLLFSYTFRSQLEIAENAKLTRSNNQKKMFKESVVVKLNFCKSTINYLTKEVDGQTRSKECMIMYSRYVCMHQMQLLHWIFSWQIVLSSSIFLRNTTSIDCHKGANFMLSMYLFHQWLVQGLGNILI